MKKEIGLGFMGCGGHSKRHADVVDKMSQFKIVGAFDVDLTSAQNFCNQYDEHLPLATTNLSEFLAIEELDAVLIGTPHKYHLDLCAAALNAKKHILCEKPLWEGQYFIEAQHIIECTLEGGLIFSSCHLRRYENEYIYIKERLDEYLRKFGKALEMRFQFFYHEPSTEWKKKDSLLLDHMNHEVDLVHFLFGHSPTRFWRLSHGFDEYKVAGKTNAGLGIWFSGYRRLKSHIFRNELELVFEHGRVRGETILDSHSGLVRSTISELSFENGGGSTRYFPAHSYDDALVGVMKNFAGAIRGEEPCYLTIDDLLVNTLICNDLLEAEFSSF